MPAVSVERVPWSAIGWEIASSQNYKSKGENIGICDTKSGRKYDSVHAVHRFNVHPEGRFPLKFLSDH